MVETRAVTIEFTGTATVDVPEDVTGEDAVAYAHAMLIDHADYIEAVDDPKQVE